MLKKCLLFFMGVMVMSGLIAGLGRIFGVASSLDEDCAFCNPAVLQRQTFYEDDLVMALYTHKPVLPGHCLISPKRHVERFEGLSDEEVTQMGRVVKRVHEAASSVFGTNPYLLLQKNGREVGQTVPHVHMHLIPRKEGDSSALKFMIQMYLANFYRPMASTEMEKIVTQMKAAMAAGEEPAQSAPEAA